MSDRRAIPDPEWQMRMHVAAEKEHIIIARDDKLKVQMETYTPKRAGSNPSKFGEPRRFWFIDGIKAEYASEDEMLDALRASDRELWVDGHWEGTTR